MSKKLIKIATRGSKLALWQSQFVADLIKEAHPSIEVELMVVKTKGDKILDVPLAKIGGKGLFVKEIEDKVLSKEADLAVHSMKDVPMEIPPGLKLGVVPKREDPRDCFVSEKYTSLESLPANAVIGTSSLRRKVQVSILRPDVEIVPLRGNLDTRMKKLKEGLFDAIIVAFAGAKRLGISSRFLMKLDPKSFIPAVGQGALGLEYREDDKDLDEILRFLDHPVTRWTVLAERSFLKTLQGGCQVPIGGFAYLKNAEIMEMIGFLCSLDGKNNIFVKKQSHVSQYESLGKAVAEEVLERGGDKILKEVYAHS